MAVAVVGCGYWGPNLVRNFKSIPQCRDVTCYDTDEARLSHIKSLYPSVTITQDFDDILGDERIAAVAIATPVHTHYRLAKECLLAGKNVLLEKPMASSSLECFELVELAQENDLTLMVGHTFEYSPAVNKVREIIESGELGDVLYLSFARLNLGLFQPDINVIWDLAPHDLSILTYLLGKQPVAVNAQGKAHYREGIEDVATAALHFDNGEIAFLHVSWLDPYKTRKVTVVGSEKMLVYDDVEVHEKVKIFDKGIDAPPHYDTFADFHFSYRYGDIYSPRIEDKEPLRLECEHFVDCIEKGLTPRSDGRAGARVVKLLEIISESIRQDGARVEVTYEARPDRSIRLAR